jgi:[ribosomal protein S5]-alanine N-acetyltransferase
MNHLETERLQLSPLIEGDVPEIHAMNSMEEVARFNTIGIPASIEVTRTMLGPIIEGKGEGKNLAWVVRLKADGSFVGEIGMNLKPERYRSGEVFYSLHPNLWGHGYAFEAVKSVVDHGFSTMNLHRIEAGVAVDNLRSIKLLEKLGMTLEGRHRKILPIRGDFSDNFHYAVLDIDRT